LSLSSSETGLVSSLCFQKCNLYRYSEARCKQCSAAFSYTKTKRQCKGCDELFCRDHVEYQCAPCREGPAGGELRVGLALLAPFTKLSCSQNTS
jgi:hypothetical protein